MGVYLSKPKVDKQSSDGENCSLVFGASSMQGWRDNQEDAHNSILNYCDEGSAFFAVYDGHGGHEVAAYCAEKLPDFIKKLEDYTKGDIEGALINGFLQFDATIATPAVINVLRKMSDLRKRQSDTEYSPESESEDNVSDLCKEAEMPIEQVVEKYTNELAATIDLKRRKLREEANRILNRTADPPTLPKTRRIETIKVEAFQASSSKTSDEVATVDNKDNVEEADSKSSDTTETDDTESDKAMETDSDVKTPSKLIEENGTTNLEDQTKLSTEEIHVEKEEETKIENGKLDVKNGDAVTEKKEEEKEEVEVKNVASSKKGKGKSPKKKQSIIQSSELYRKLLLNFSKKIAEDGLEEEESEEDQSFIGPEETSSSDEDMNTTFEGADDDDSDEEEEEEEVEEEECISEDDVVQEYMAADDEEDNDFVGERYDRAMEEAGMDSGCTAVVALLKDNELYVANAGDSRCVLCRNGEAIDMSLDHKPEDELEKTRIRAAGGHVSSDGRVNGGLNLSRAIGDHAYKQNKRKSPQEQMITALPDVKKITINPAEDSFLVLACDGIWNSMSSQEVVDFIKPKLDTKEKLSEICEELFDKCLAPNTMGDGTGCDNMTAIIVKFKGSRKRSVCLDSVDDSIECKRIKLGAPKSTESATKTEDVVNKPSTSSPTASTSSS